MDSVRQVWLLEHHTLGNVGRQIRQRSTLNHTLATTGSQESVRRNRRIQRALTKLYAITKGWLLRLEIALYGKIVTDDDVLAVVTNTPNKWQYSRFRAINTARWRYRVSELPPGELRNTALRQIRQRRS